MMICFCWPAAERACCMTGCVELARREHVVLEVCSAFSDAPGTIVG